MSVVSTAEYAVRERARSRTGRCALSDVAIYRELFDLAPDAIVVVDAAGRIVLANAMVAPIFGYTPEELLGKDIDSLLPPPMRERHAGHRRDYGHAPRNRSMGSGLELFAQHRDGHEIRVEVSLSPLKLPDGVLVMAAVRDVTERHLLAGERDRLRAEMELRQDRDRIAMDLHDGIIQSLYAVGLGLEIAVDQMGDEGAEAREQVDRSIEQLSRVVQDIRRYIYELRPTQYNGDLLGSFQALARDFGAASSMEVELELPPELAVEVAQEAALAALHIGQEALTNAQKHARASRVAVRLQADGDRIELSVTDDGDGFALREFSDDHHGLRNMRLRCELVGGAFSVTSEPGRGTMIAASIPLDLSPR